jgi:YD repeat-containing protein
MTQMNSPNAVQQDFGYDTTHRPTTAELSTGATVSYSYSTDGRVTTATVNGKFTRTTTDGLGRPVKVEKGHGTTVVSIVESEYTACACSPVGKLKRVTRPYAPGGTKYWTSYTYDVLGRTTRIDAPAGQFTTYEYVGNTVKVTDAVGKWKTYTLDSAGNIAKVTERIRPGARGTRSTRTTG